MSTDVSVERKNGITAATEDILTHHLNCFGKGDLGGIMADYNDESRLFTPDGILRGSEAIRRFFIRLFEEFAKPGMSFEMIRREVNGDAAYIVWKAETADNHYEVAVQDSDRRVVRGGAVGFRSSLARSASRDFTLPDVRNDFIGFRPARTYR